jgi:hypothetical protein
MRSGCRSMLTLECLAFTRRRHTAARPAEGPRGNGAASLAVLAAGRAVAAPPMPAGGAGHGAARYIGNTSFLR